jgi:hypothetical protein
MGLRDEALHKPRVERITAPMDSGYSRSEAEPRFAPVRSSSMSSEAQRQAVQLPPIERMYQPRGTLTEKERPSTFEREPIDHGSHNNSVVRLTPKTDSRHVPSGPRDLKDYDQPAYLRRGVALPPIEETDEANAAAVTQNAQMVEHREEIRQRDPDDRPAFLKKIMD